MNDIDHVDILIKLVFEIAFEKVEKSDIEKPIFQGGAKNSLPLILKGLKFFVHPVSKKTKDNATNIKSLLTQQHICLPFSLWKTFRQQATHVSNKKNKFVCRLN